MSPAGQVPRWNIEAEESVLGAMLVSEGALAGVLLIILDYVQSMRADARLSTASSRSVRSVAV